MPMIRLKYVSRMSRPLTDVQVKEMTRKAAQKNADLGITGVLFTSGGLFVQVLEGPQEAVESLFASIEADPRHRDVIVLETEHEVTERLFPEWSMERLTLDPGAKDRLEPLRAIVATISEQRQRIEVLTHVLEKALHRELTTLLTRGQ